MNGDPRIVGEPLLIFFGREIYNPIYFLLSVFKFIYYEDFQPYYIRSFLFVLIFGIAALLFSIIWNGILNVFFVEKNTSHGTARPATNKDLKENGLLQKTGVVCGQCNKAVIKANKSKDSSIHLKQIIRDKLIAHLGTVNTLCIMPTGSGKGVSIVIPTLLYYLYSIIVFDPKGENYNITAGYRRTFSHVIKFEPCSFESPRFNPVMEIRDGDEFYSSDAGIIAEIIFPADKSKGDNAYWIDSARELLRAVILHLRFSDYPDKTLAGVTHFLSGMSEITPQYIESLKDQSGGREENPNLGKNQFIEMMDISKPHYFKLTKQMYERNAAYYDSVQKKIGDKIFSNTLQISISEVAKKNLDRNPKELASVFSEIFSAMELFTDPTIAHATSGCDFSIDDFINSEKPISLYIVIPYSDINRLSMVTRMLIDFMMKKFTSGTTQYGSVRLKNNLLFLLDEFPVLGKFQSIHDAMAVTRGYGVFFLIICQTLSQLRDLYSENHRFLDNCPVQILAAPGNIQDAELYSRMIGQESVQQAKISRSGRSRIAAVANYNFSDNDFGRALFDGADILRLPGDKLLIRVHNMQVYIAEKVVYYEDSRFTRRYKPYLDNLPKTKAEVFSELAGLPSNIQRKQEKENEIKERMERIKNCIVKFGVKEEVNNDELFESDEEAEIVSRCVDMALVEDEKSLNMQEDQEMENNWGEQEENEESDDDLLGGF